MGDRFAKNFSSIFVYHSCLHKLLKRAKNAVKCHISSHLFRSTLRSNFSTLTLSFFLYIGFERFFSVCFVLTMCIMKKGHLIPLINRYDSQLGIDFYSAALCSNERLDAKCLIRILNWVHFLQDGIQNSILGLVDSKNDKM